MQYYFHRQPQNKLNSTVSYRENNRVDGYCQEDGSTDNEAAQQGQEILEVLVESAKKDKESLPVPKIRAA
jgi:hypothetical protein